MYDGQVIYTMSDLRDRHKDIEELTQKIRYVEDLDQRLANVLPKELEKESCSPRKEEVLLTVRLFSFFALIVLIVAASVIPLYQPIFALVFVVLLLTAVGSHIWLMEWT